MIRRRNAILLAAGLLAPLALVGRPAGAIDQDLVVSATTGPPGTEVTVSSASCVAPPDGDVSLDVSFFTGTAPNQQIAAFASGYEGSATITIPDWVDPAQPAVIEAHCSIYGDTEENLDYTPVDFVVTPGAGAPVQVRTFSRTELLAGQGLTVSGSCGASLGGGFVQAIIVTGTDQTGQDFDDIAGQGYTQVEADGSFDLDLYATNAYVSLDASFDQNDNLTDIGATEVPMNVPAGDYTAFVYCSDQNAESLQFLEPQPIVITGAAPTDGIDLTVAQNTANVTIAGECTNGDVTGGLEGYSAADFSGGSGLPDEALHANRFATARTKASDVSATARRAADANLIRSQRGSGRALAGDGFAEFQGTPGADGAWSFSDTAGFDEGVVVGVALCGDPMADGYLYDPQGVAVKVIAPVTTTTTTTTTAPPPAAADAVTGTPTYAG